MNEWILILPTIHLVCYEVNGVPPYSYVEAPTPNVVVVRDRAFIEIIKVK